jgi:hypothetical protein
MTSSQDAWPRQDLSRPRNSFSNYRRPLILAIAALLGFQGAAVVAFRYLSNESPGIRRSDVVKAVMSKPGLPKEPQLAVEIRSNRHVTP